MRKLLLLSVLFTFASCTTSTRKSIESDRQSVGTVQSEEEVTTKARSILEKAEISKDQKHQFVELYRSHRVEALKIEEEIREYRLVLLKALVDKDFSQRKFDIVSGKIKRLVLKRYNLSMLQYRKGKEILGVAAGSVYDDPWFEMMHKF